VKTDRDSGVWNEPRRKIRGIPVNKNLNKHSNTRLVADLKSKGFQE
jgi:hypothetical protein